MASETFAKTNEGEKTLRRYYFHSYEKSPRNFRKKRIHCDLSSFIRTISFLSVKLSRMCKFDIKHFFFLFIIKVKQFRRLYCIIPSRQIVQRRLSGRNLIRDAISCYQKYSICLHCYVAHAEAVAAPLIAFLETLIYTIVSFTVLCFSFCLLIFLFRQ